ncbi:MAG TPA: PAS domain-containing protein [Chitinophagaceae bacterium]|nr:PAS domain-containing protein [Chitinophagaceae bacterium]
MGKDDIYHCIPLSKNMMINDLSKMVFIASLETRSIVRCNQVMENIVGYSQEEMETMGSEFFKALIHPLDYPRSLNIRDIFLAGWTRHQNRCRIYLAKSRGWYWSNADIEVKKKDKKGNPKEIIAYCGIRGKVWPTIKEETSHEHPLIIQKLTACEQELLPYLAAGIADGRIATDLYKSQKTVRTQVKHIMKVLNIHKRIKLVAFLKRIGY